MLISPIQAKIGHQALNECLYGFGMRAAAVGFSLELGSALMEKLRSAIERGEATEVTEDEAAILRQALEATFRELDWDFSTRMGADLQEAQALREWLGHEERKEQTC